MSTTAPNSLRNTMTQDDLPPRPFSPAGAVRLPPYAFTDARAAVTRDDSTAFAARKPSCDHRPRRRGRIVAVRLTLVATLVVPNARVDLDFGGHIRIGVEAARLSPEARPAPPHEPLRLHRKRVAAPKISGSHDNRAPRSRRCRSGARPHPALASRGP
ncbi:MAG TPA: hypothetical protein VK446_01520, partial [Methylocystis sp.]|nr:hypothetical protein [Methylocystis sp.]